MSSPSGGLVMELLGSYYPDSFAAAIMAVPPQVDGAGIGNTLVFLFLHVKRNGKDQTYVMNLGGDPEHGQGLNPSFCSGSGYPCYFLSNNLYSEFYPINEGMNAPFYTPQSSDLLSLETYLLNYPEGTTPYGWDDTLIIGYHRTNYVPVPPQITSHEIEITPSTTCNKISFAINAFQTATYGASANDSFTCYFTVNSEVNSTIYMYNGDGVINNTIQGFPNLPATFSAPYASFTYNGTPYVPNQGDTLYVKVHEMTVVNPSETYESGAFYDVNVSACNTPNGVSRVYYSKSNSMFGISFWWILLAVAAIICIAFYTPIVSRIASVYNKVVSSKVFKLGRK